MNPGIDTLPQIAHERATDEPRDDRKGRRPSLSGANGAVLYHAPRAAPEGRAVAHEGGAVPDGSIGGRALVTRRAIIDIVRRVTLGDRKSVV